MIEPSHVVPPPAASAGRLRWLREASWLNRRRLTVYPRLFLVGYLAVASLWLAMSHDLVDRNGKPLGSNFAGPYTASRMALAGNAASVYDWVRHHEAEEAVFGGRDIPIYSWHYPPLFLLAVLPLALLPYGWALLVYLSVTFAGYVAVLWRILRPDRRAMTLALAFPGVFVNASEGQNGFLSVALLGGGLLLMDSSPYWAGVLLGLLVYKPQLAALALLVTLATGRWKVLLTAAAVGGAAALLSLAVFGIDTWQAFLASVPLTRAVVLEAGGAGLSRMQSVFSGVRLVGGGVALAYGVQAVATLAAAAAAVWSWRQPLSFGLRAAILCLATPLVTPYAFDYDLVLLALPIAWLALDGIERGFLPWEKSMLALLWLLPMGARLVAGALYLPIGPLVLAAALVVALNRARLRPGLPIPSRRRR